MLMKKKRHHRAFQVRCAGCVVFRQGADELEVVIARRSDGEWTFPRGKVIDGENPRSAAAREVLEEVGARATPTVALGGYAYPIGTARFKTVEFFAAQVAEDAVLSPDGREFVDVGWFTVSEARTLVSARDAVLLGSLLQLHEANAVT